MDGTDGLLDREQLIDLVGCIQNFSGSDEELDVLVRRFSEGVPHPAASDLIYYTDEIRTPEEVVDEALAYRPIPMGAPDVEERVSGVGDSGASGWAERLCQVPDALRAGNLPIRAAFQQAEPDLMDRARAVVEIRRHLREQRDLVDQWQQYSYDKRSSPSPYLDQTEVGFYDQGYEGVQHFDDPVDACAEFVFREAAWVLERRR